jgi:hypothetical protein
MSLCFVPEAGRTREVCARAVAFEKYSLATGYREPITVVPPALLTPHLIHTALNRHCIVRMEERQWVCRYLLRAGTDSRPVQPPPTTLRTAWLALLFDPQFSLTTYAGTLQWTARQARSARLFFERAVQQQPKDIQWTPLDQRSYSMCLRAVEADGRLLRYVPPALCDDTLCDTALGYRHSASFERLRDTFAEIPRAMQTVERCLRAVDATHRLSVLPPHCLHRAFYEAYIKRYPERLEDCPPSLRTEAMYLSRVKVHGLFLASVPHRFKTKTVCQAAVHHTPLSIEFAPEDYSPIPD